MKAQRITQMAAGALFGLTLLATSVQAQEDWLAVSWGAALAGSDTKAFAGSGASFRNVSIDYSRFTQRHVAFGFTAAWTVFTERFEDATASFEGVDINGTQVRYVNAFPLLVTGRYFVTGRENRDSADFWIGGGAGALIGENQVDLGQFRFRETNWHLALAPEAGVVFPMQRDFAIFGQAKYTYAFKTAGVAPRFWNFNVGLAWRN